LVFLRRSSGQSILCTAQGNMDDDGLGPVSWWDSYEQVDQEE